MEIRFGSKFRKQYHKSDKKVRTAFKSRLELFQKNKFHSLLNNHELIGTYKGFRSINVTGDWRAIYSETIDKNGNSIITFELLGTHSQLYK